MQRGSHRDNPSRGRQTCQPIQMVGPILILSPALVAGNGADAVQIGGRGGFPGIGRPPEWEAVVQVSALSPRCSLTGLTLFATWLSAGGPAIRAWPGVEHRTAH
jgi:hypothetical protein